jgi:hypothetical protein
MGGMGAVYEVEDRTTGGRVALKVMLAQDARRLLRFKQEFRVVAELHHPNLVRLFDLGQHEGLWFFTMELVHGQDLVEVLLGDEGARPTPSTIAARPALRRDAQTLTAFDRPGPERAPDTTRDPPRPGRVACDPALLVPIVAQVLDALELLHGRGIVHRDLKPSNILVDMGGTVRLLDFGLASRTDREAGISQEGTVLGTLAYLSPEQCRGEPASPASDLYALGCMMFQLLTGELPFEGPPAQAVARRTEDPPPRVEERVVDAPPALASAVHRLMARDPAERPSIEALRAALGLSPAQHPASTAASTPARATAEIFVGREREIAVLDGCLARAAAGEPQIALVSGPSGIGKSALAAVAAERAAHRGFLCFSGRCYEREQVPFVAFDRVMDAVTLALRGWPPEHLVAMRPWLRALERVFPALGLLTGSAPGSAEDEVSSSEPPEARAGADPRELHQRAFDGFRRLCAHFQAQAPLCFVLDDLQWADDESVALLSALLSGGAGRIMVLGLYRAEGLREDHPLHALLRRLPAEGRASAIALSALGPAEAAHLVRTVTGGRLDPEASEALASQAAYSPFLVRRLAERVATLTRRERAARPEEVGSSESLIRTMIAELSPRAEEVLALAATAGGDVDPSLLREASGIGGADLDLAVGELVASRFLKAVPGGADAGAPRLDLYHDRIREVAYQGLAEDRRRALHGRLARAIEARAAGRGRDAEVLARHFGEAGDRAARRRYLVEAAEQAAGKFAFLHAARLFREVLGDPDPGEDPLAAAARWERVGDLYEYGGRHLDAARAYQEAQRRWDEARDDDAGPTARAVARLRLRGLAGANLVATDHVREGRAAFEEGLALIGLPLDRPPALRIAVLAALQAQAALAGRADEILGAVGRARGGAGDPRRAAEVRFLDLMVRAFQPLWPLPAAEAALRAELLGRRVDDRRVLLRSLAFGAAVPVFLGRCTPPQLDRAHVRLDAADRLARDNDIPLGRELVQLNRSLLWLATDPARARRTCEAALEGFARRGMAESFDGDLARAYHLYILLMAGDDDDARAVIERELAAPHPNFINVATFLDCKVMILCNHGQLEEAREALRRLLSQIAGVPASRLDLGRARATARVLLAEGRFAEALAQREVQERAARESGASAIGFDRSLWLEIELQAALGLLRRGELSARERRRARASAGWLVRRGVFDRGSMGYRAIALLDHAEGRTRTAIRAIRRALSISSTNANPYHRWLCLEAARDLGAITLDGEAEAAELASARRFALPAGWSP